MERITVEATINSAIDKVWEYYTQPEHIVRWNNASPDWHTPSATNDLRAGGRFVYRMEAKDGSGGFDFDGVYDEVEANSFFNYTMSDGRKVDTRMEDVDGKTKITVTFDPETENDPDFQKEGWQAILDNFKNYAESN